MRRQLPIDDHPQTLRAELAPSLVRFLRVTLGAAASIVGLWLLSSLLMPSPVAAAVVTPMVGSTHPVQRTAAAAPMSAGDGKGKGRPGMANELRRPRQPAAADNIADRPRVSAASKARAQLTATRAPAAAVLAAKRDRKYDKLVAKRAAVQQKLITTRAAMDTRTTLSQLTLLRRQAKDNLTLTRQQLIDAKTTQRQRLKDATTATRQHLRDAEVAMKAALHQAKTATEREQIRANFTTLREAIGAEGHDVQQAVAAQQNAIRQAIAGNGNSVREVLSALITKAQGASRPSAPIDTPTQAPVEQAPSAADQAIANAVTTANTELAQAGAATQLAQDVGGALASVRSQVDQIVHTVLSRLILAIQNFAKHLPSGSSTT